MRHLVVSACLCLITWSGATGADPTRPLGNFTGIATNKGLGDPSENIDAGLAPSDPDEAVALPLAPLHPLLKPIIHRSRQEICDTLAEAARSNDLPADFFIRLLYQESSFRPDAVSSAGAQGIAQFMPETAADRGLDNPFDPLQAIPASARLLRDLLQKFGNLGLAAAAYNAGPRRVEDWLANRGKLPQETQDYVKTITGWPAETWTVAKAGDPAVKLPRSAPCQEAVGELVWNGPDQIPLPLRNPRTKDFSNHVRAAQQPLVLFGSDNRSSDQRPAAGGMPPRNPRAQDLSNHVKVAQEPAVLLGSDNRSSDQRPAAGSGTTAAHPIKLLMNVQGNKAYHCELYGKSKFCTMR